MKIYKWILNDLPEHLSSLDLETSPNLQPTSGIRDSFRPTPSNRLGERMMPASCGKFKATASLAKRTTVHI